MIKQATIPGSAVLEIRNVPTELILYAVTQWTPCNKYVKKGRGGKNTNEFIKGISVWLILKNETPSGKIQNYRSQLIDLAAKCKMCERSLDKYIAWLKAENLVHLDGTSLMVHSYDALREYGINPVDRHEPIYYDTTKKKVKLADIITAIGIERFKDKPMYAYWKKVTKNPDALSELSNHLVAYGADRSRLEDPGYFRQCHEDLLQKTYKEAGAGQSSFYLLHKHMDANPDLNFKAATYAKKMGYSVHKRTNPVTKKDESVSIGFCHLKCRLSKQGLLTITKTSVVSDYRARKDEKIFHHRWVQKTKKTIWFMPDKITINHAAIYQPKAAA